MWRQREGRAACADPIASARGLVVGLTLHARPSVGKAWVLWEDRPTIKAHSQGCRGEDLPCGVVTRQRFLGGSSFLSFVAMPGLCFLFLVTHVRPNTFVLHVGALWLSKPTL